MKTKP